ncbi:tRNA:m(4)X modification enzyme TRM13 (tRNA methylase 13) [Durusdinium trenchii]|uniref:tRNA:m(4)X modification enzyme TRM13 n=1 Tax=Durusdinium trenchii TaxID=1381693 RepID=A0ABP0HBJ0_9DINO
MAHETEKPRREEYIETVLPWLRQCGVRDLQAMKPTLVPDSVSNALDAVIRRSQRHTFQEAKALKHRVQIEAIASHCLSCISPDLVIELGAGQGILGQTLSSASSCPLVAVDRRGNTDAFDTHHDLTEAEVACSFHRIRTEIASLNEDQLPELLGAKKTLLLAKHLCGHGSDAAIDLAIKLGSSLGLLCLAPCCYVTMRWEHLCPDSQKWLQEASFPGEAHAFDLLVDTIRLARGGPNACTRWRLRESKTEEEIQELGRKACRIIDEARLSRLESHGFKVVAVEYCHPDTSPDNVLLLAAPMTSTSSFPLPSGPTKADLGVSCLLELDPTASPSLTTRLGAYLLTMKACGDLPLISVMTESPIDGTVLKNSLFLTATDRPRLQQLVQKLCKDVLLQRVVTRFLPLTDCSGCDMCSLVKEVTEILEELSTEKSTATLRVAAKPRSLEKVICESFSPKFLSPTHFTHVLSVLASSDQLTYSIVPRETLDPSAWSEACQSQDLRVFQRFDEVLCRWPRRFQHLVATALWTDLVRPGVKEWLSGVNESRPVVVITCEQGSGQGAERLKSNIMNQA